MVSLATVLTEEVCALARRELRRQTAPADKAAARCERDIAALKRQLQALQRELSALPGPATGEGKKTARRKSPRRTSAQKAHAKSPSAKSASKFSAGELKAHRERLGLSADRYGKLIGVSGLSIYNWEQGKARPRSSSIDAWTAIRRIGKREAAKRLAGRDAPETAPESAQAPTGE